MKTMQLNLNKETLTALKRKEVRSLILNFANGMIRICSDEKIGLTDKTQTGFYHIHCDKPTYQDKGNFYLHSFYLEYIMKLLKVGDVVTFTIESNGTDQLTKDGYYWEMLYISFYRGKNYFRFKVTDEISKDSQYYIRPSETVRTWGDGTVFNIWES